MDFIDPAYEAMALSDPNAQSFLDFMDAQYELMKIAVAKNPLPIGNCYWNVARVVNDHGGSVVLGWLINIWPGSHIEAMHHAVYKNISGQLVDVTEGYSTVAPGTPVTFLPDDRLAVNLDKLPNIPARFFALSDRPQTKNFINACEQLHSLDTQNSDFLYAAGYRCEAQFRKTYRLAPEPITNFTDSDLMAIGTLARRTQNAREQIADAITALRSVS